MPDNPRSFGLEGNPPQTSPFKVPGELKKSGQGQDGKVGEE
jgi:hypothetical protein